MALLKFLKGDYARLNTAAISEGQVIICEDTGEMFVDVADSNRIKIGDFITVENIEALGQLDATAVPTSRLYYVEDGNILARSNGTTWVQVNKQKTTDELKDLLGLDKYATIEYVNSKHPYEILDNGNVVFASDIIANRDISLQKISTGLNSVRATVGGLESTVGNLSNYWQYGENTDSVVTAINQNADWVLRSFEQTANKTQNLGANKTSDLLYPSAKAVYDLFGPHIIYDDPTGFEANDKDVGKWQLTGLDLTPYKRVKFYIKAAEKDSTGSPSHIVEIHLDDRAKNAQGHFTGGHTAVFPDATGKFHNVICSVSGDKTAVAFNRANRYSVSTSATSIGGRYCYLIEGYLI